MSADQPPVGDIGVIVLILIFLLLIVGLVVVVRLVLARLRGREQTSARADARPGEADSVGPGRGEAGDSEAAGAPGRPRVSGRVLKRRYLAGAISREQYEDELRRLQLEEYLEGDE